MADSSTKKRPAESQTGDDSSKRQKGKNKWQATKKSKGKQDAQSTYTSNARQPEDGWSGIWVTCDRNREARSVSELKPLFDEHAAKLYDIATDEDSNETAGDIEDEIAKELASMRNKKPGLFTSIPIVPKCLLFFKTVSPIEPVNFVVSYCKDVAAHPARKQTRAVQRLIPITLVGKATENGVNELAAKVLGPHFHGEDSSSKKFAIRVARRNHDTLTRDQLIRQVAAAVGPGHQVDLKDYDLLILVEIYQSTCGMSVVDKTYDDLKKFNLSEIYSPKAAADTN